MKTKILLGIIIFIAALSRLIAFGQLPNGFNGDEAGQGYTSYSILTTGKDEWGKVFPIFPRGFGDFKSPVYSYLTIPSVAIFGLTVEAVRFPAAMLGVLTVLIVYFLGKELFNDKIGLWSAFLLAISPWHIQISRTAFEANAGILFFSLGLLFFLKWLKNGHYLLWSSLFWGLTFYTYDAYKFFMGIFVFLIILLYRKKLFKRTNILPAVIILIFILPFIFNLQRSTTRVSDVGIISSKVIEGYFNSKIHTPLPQTLDRFFDNKIYFLGNQFVNNYLSYYSPTFFFTDQRSDSSYLNFPYFPLLYPIELIFWLITGFYLFTQKYQHKKLLFLWLLTAPLAASITNGSMNAHRSPTFLPLTAIISGLGIMLLINSIKEKISYRKIKIKELNISFIMILILLCSFILFGYFYFIKLPQKPPYNLRYGYDQVFQEINKVQNQYDQIVISKVFTEPQIFVAFYGKIDPKIFQRNANDWLRYEKAGRLYVDQLESWNLEKFYFEDINWDKKESKRVNALVVSKPQDFPEDVTSILDVKDTKGIILYRLVPTNKK